MAQESTTDAVIKVPTCGACCTRIENLSVSLGGASIIEGVSLHIHCGELLALIGPNGAGKTTLLRSMLGELRHSGRIVFSPVGVSADGARPPRVGYVPQKLDIDVMSPTTVLDLFAAATSQWPVCLGVRRSVANRASEDLRIVGAHDLLRKKIGCLSGGELQRVLLALALSPRPDILLLDEPVASVDRAGVELFHRIVSQLRKDFDLAVVLVSHDFSMVARFADRVVFLNKRILRDGSPNDVLTSTLFKQTFGFEPVAVPSTDAPPTHHHLHRRAKGADA